jgi:lipoyl(octanoyl) transferase
MRSLWLGRVDYGEALRLQRELAARRIDGGIGDVLLLLEHPRTITLGRGADRSNLLLSPEDAASQGISICEVDRGGDVTWHGPGQLVGYPIIDLAAHRRDVHWYLRELEGALVDTLCAFGIESRRFPPHTGVWVGDRKIAAIGVKVSRWVTTHGFALNVTAPAEEFSGIVPCGIRDYGVTSILEVTGREFSLLEVAREGVRVFSRRFGNTAGQEEFPQGLLTAESEKILSTALDMA